MVCEKLFSKIEELYPEYLKVWEDICNIESPTDYKHGVDMVMDYFESLSSLKGWKVERYPQEVSGDVLCVILNPDSTEAPVTYSGHVDTVHPLGSFGTPAVRMDDEYIYGPGVLDCKGGVVASFLALEALTACGYNNRPVMVLLQSDEEKSSMPSGKSTINYICERAKDSVAFLNTESEKPGFGIIARKGIVRYRLTVKGKAVHSSACFREGSNAIAEMASKILKLEKMKDPDGITCNCGVIEGGTVANTVPDRCSLIIDIRYATFNELEYVEKTVNEIAQTNVIPGCSCTVELVSRRNPMELCEKNQKLLRRMNEIYKENDLMTLEEGFSAGGSDAADTTTFGIPTIDSMGVRGGGIHSTREYAHLDSLVRSAKYLASVAYCI